MLCYCSECCKHFGFVSISEHSVQFDTCALRGNWKLSRVLHLLLLLGLIHEANTTLAKDLSLCHLCLILLF